MNLLLSALKSRKPAHIKMPLWFKLFSGAIGLVLGGQTILYVLSNNFNGNFNRIGPINLNKIHNVDIVSMNYKILNLAPERITFEGKISEVYLDFSRIYQIIYNDNRTQIDNRVINDFSRIYNDFSEVYNDYRTYNNNRTYQNFSRVYNDFFSVYNHLSSVYINNDIIYNDLTRINSELSVLYTELKNLSVKQEEPSVIMFGNTGYPNCPHTVTPALVKKEVRPPSGGAQSGPPSASRDWDRHW